jgi:hypothetical protein
MERVDFLVRKDDLTNYTSARFEPISIMPPGHVELTIDRFGFTCNNLTYARLGDRMSYWDFFPARDASWGRVPAWGFGTAVRSTHDGVRVGERFFGFYPMSSSVIVCPTGVDAAGFLDDAANRRVHDPVYNEYLRTTNDGAYQIKTEALQAVWRPPFTAAFLLDDFLGENYVSDNPVTILFSAASSRTSYATAFLLAQRRKPHQSFQVFGLTSRENAEFTRGLRLYDEVVTYEEVGSLTSAEPMIYLDVAGNPAVRARVHERFAPILKHSHLVGAAHGLIARPTAPLPGCQPSPFFAPSQAAKRRKDWTAAGLQARMGASWGSFLTWITSLPHVSETILEVRGAEAVGRVYHEALASGMKPHEAFVMTLSG